MIFEAIWEYYFDPGTNLIDVHVGRLRRKVDQPGLAPLIKTTAAWDMCSMRLRKSGGRRPSASRWSMAWFSPLGVVALLGLIYASAAVFLTHQMDEIVIGQARALQSVPAAALPERMRQVETQDVRNVNFYGLFSRDGIWIAGDVAAPSRRRAGERRPARAARAGFQPGARALAERLPSGQILFVGFDARPFSGLRTIILASADLERGADHHPGPQPGAALSLGPLRRIQAVQEASLPILGGDVSARLPTSTGATRSTCWPASPTT